MDELKSLQKTSGNTQKRKPSRRRRRKRGNPFVEFLRMYGKYILLVILAIAVVAAVIIFVGKKKGQPAAGTTPAETQAETTAPASSEAAGLPGGELVKDGNEKVNALVASYFTAVQNCDTAALATMVDSADAISEDALKAEKEYVESYENISCYTLNGPTDGTYITYAGYDMKFVNVTTPAPCLIRLYICTNTDGNLYISNRAADDTVTKYMEEVNAREDIKALMTDTDNRLTEAMASDASLNTLVIKLYGGSSETEAASEGASESAAESTQAAETTAAAVDQSSYTDVDETVYATENIKIRKTPDANGEVAGVLAGGTSIHRTGYNENWSRVEYNGETCYIAAGYLKTSAPSESGFTEVDETVYAKETVRIRKSPEEGAEVVGSLLTGESLKRTGYSDSWSRVIYEGKTCYIGAGYLTTEKPE